MTIAGPQATTELGRALAGVLGLDPKLITAITLELRVGWPAMLEVESFVPAELGDCLVTEVAHYKLVREE